MKAGGDDYAPLAEINVTPLVDVMLVLLIIFMVAAPMMQQGLEVELPKVEAKGFSDDSMVIVSISAGMNVYINNEGVINLKDLGGRLKREGKKEVLIKADKKVPYGFVMQVMGKIKKSGIEKVGMVTDPEK